MGETVAEAGWMGQDERRGALRTGRGGPDPSGGHGDTAGCLAAEQTSPAASVQDFAYVRTGSVS